MLTPAAGIAGYEPLEELDAQLGAHDEPIALYLTREDAAYFAIGRPRKARFRLADSLGDLADRYPDTYFGLPVRPEYDESLLYDNDYLLEHENCWVADWSFPRREDDELGPHDYVLALRTKETIGRRYTYVLVFEFQYEPEYRDNAVDSPFDAIALHYDGPWAEYNRIVEHVTETYGGRSSYPLSPDEKARHWPPQEPLEGYDDEGGERGDG